MMNLIIRSMVVVLLFTSCVAKATSIRIVNRDGAGEGFNSTASRSPVAGNSATTLGGQYLNVFRAAASFWEGKIISSVPILVDASLDPLECERNSGVLGSAGPISVARDFPNAPVRNTFYSVAQANSLARRDLDPGGSDIGAIFNSRLNGGANCLRGMRWWLGIDSPAPNGTISLYDTVLHEIGHGLGFLALVNQNGERLLNRNDAFILNLLDLRTNRAWSSLSNAQRASSSVSDGQLVWRGRNVADGARRFTRGRSQGRLRMFAPRGFQPGSSVSHWDTALFPDELMEPFATRSSDSCATVLALSDMGWNTRNECSGGAGALPAVIFPLLLDEDDAP